jgi:iron complex transport system ATP-binding protein
VALNAGELVCLLGPNGAGKSTLLRTLAALQPPLAGRVLLDGADLHAMPARERARRLSVVLTDRIQVGQLTAYTLFGLGRYPHTNWSGRLTEADHAVIRRALAATGATDLAARPVGDLSDGERQKVLIARALAQEPRLMVLDEITAFLDLPRRVEVMRLLGRLARTTENAVLLATHDLDLALRSADRIWLLPRGGPLQVGAPEDLILSGAFESVFATEGVAFDRADGSFRLHRAYHSVVTLVGTNCAGCFYHGQT